MNGVHAIADVAAGYSGERESVKEKVIAVDQIERTGAATPKDAVRILNIFSQNLHANQD